MEHWQEFGKRIIFVRHGESIGNALGIDDNSLASIPNHLFQLTRRGREQGQRAGAELKRRGLVWQAGFISTYLRTRDTWEEINSVYPICPTEPIVDPRLDEWRRGIWHNMIPADIARLYPLEGTIQEREGRYHYRAPGGQSGPDVELQIRYFMWDFLCGCYSRWSTILIVGHGRWETLFWRLLMGASIDDLQPYLDGNKFANGSIAIFDSNGFSYTEV